MTTLAPLLKKLLFVLLLLTFGISNAQMIQLINQSGNLQVRGDACGTNTASCPIIIEKTAVATTVFKAYIYYTGTPMAGDAGPNIITLTGPSVPTQVVPVTNACSSLAGSSTVWTRYEDVTALLGPGLNAAAPGTNLTYTSSEANSSQIDGVGIIVVWNAPTVITSGIHVSIGSGACGGAIVVQDSIHTAPINTGVPGFVARLGTGFAFSTATGNQVSTVWVNNSVISTVAGGLDDGDQFANGCLITLGGYGDNTSWATEDEFSDVAPLIPMNSTLFTYRIIGAANDWVNAVYFEITGATIVLPVEMVSFDVTCNSETNMLEWSTASEVNNDMFIVQRSYDGITFENIGQVDGNGNSNTLNTYYFEDPTNKKVAYYRLKQVDFNGESVLSEMVASTCNSQESEVVIYPNPATDVFNINITTKRGTQEIMLTDMLGNVVLSQQHELETGYNQLNIDVSDLSPGVYFVQILSDSDMEPYTEKIIKR